MSDTVENLDDMKIGVAAVEQTVNNAKLGLADHIHRMQVAPWVFHDTCTRLRDGEYAGVEPERWWRIAEGVQLGVDHWVEHGVQYDWAVAINE